MNVLIIEDEKYLVAEIAEYLTLEGYLCDMAATGRTALEKINDNTYDFFLLDLGLPDKDGLDILTEIKTAQREAAVIILTARGSTGDKIKGLNEGADDYLPKPFSLPELASRMIAINRRKHGIATNEIDLHGFKINIENRMVNYEKTKINLTKKEFDILQYLALNKNRIITRLQLTEHIWGDVLEIESDSNFVDVHVKNLRKKLSAYCSIDWFETVRSIGYRVNY